MFNGGSGISLADIAAVTRNNGDGGNGGFADGNGWWILIILFALFGWGGNGSWGNGGNTPAAASTQAEVQRGFDTSAITTKLNGIENGICSLGYDQLAQMNGINTNIMQTGFGITNAIQQDTVANMQNANAISRQLSDCCCENRSAIAQVRYDMATDTCATQNTINSTTRDVIDNANANTRSILDFLVQDKISTLQAENQNLRLAASQSAQNATLMAAMDANTAQIIRRTGNDCPIPAYVVPNPNCCYGNPAGVGYGFSNGCSGCGC